MTTDLWMRGLVTATAALALAACGGGGGTNIASTPAPVATPVPTPAPTSPPVATANAAIFSPAPTGPLVSTTANEPAAFQIRYDAAANTYSVSSDSATWQVLKTFNDTPNPTSLPFDGGALNISDRSTYSAMGHISNGMAGDLIAFGVATPASGVPRIGSASYTGVIRGQTDVTSPFGPEYNDWIEGTVQLAFNFGAGTLAGSMHPTLYSSVDAWDWGVSKDLGQINLVDTVFGAGSTGFSGRFDTSLAGANGFSGMFTGPAAQELVGRWALPFTYSRPELATGTEDLHHAWGVMIAKSHP